MIYLKKHNCLFLGDWQRDLGGVMRLVQPPAIPSLSSAASSLTNKWDCGQTRDYLFKKNGFVPYLQQQFGSWTSKSQKTTKSHCSWGRINDIVNLYKNHRKRIKMRSYRLARRCLMYLLVDDYWFSNRITDESLI